MTDNTMPQTYRAESLDADTADLIVWYESHFGKKYKYADVFPPDVSREQSNYGKYPLPDSYNYTAERQRNGHHNKQKQVYNHAKYCELVRDLQARGYVTIDEAATTHGVNLTALRRAVRSGKVMVEDAIGFWPRGVTSPRFFIAPDVLAAYVAQVRANKLAQQKRG